MPYMLDLWLKLELRKFMWVQPKIPKAQKFEVPKIRSPKDSKPNNPKAQKYEAQISEVPKIRSPIIQKVKKIQKNCRTTLLIAVYKVSGDHIYIYTYIHIYI